MSRTVWLAIIVLLSADTSVFSQQRRSDTRQSTVKEDVGRAVIRSSRRPLVRGQSVQKASAWKIVPPSPDESGDAVETRSAGIRDRVTLEELRTLALERNPTLAQASAGVEAERGSYEQAGLYPNPQVGYLNNSASPSSAVQSNGVFLSQEFVTANKLGLARTWAGHEFNRVGWEAEAQRIRVLNDLEIRYFEALGAQQAIVAIGKLEQIAEQGLTTAGNLRENKQVGKSDVLQATIQLETIRVTREDAELRYRTAWQQLANIVGEPHMPQAWLEGTLEGEVPELDFDETLQELLAKSPQITSSQAALDHSRAEWRLAKAQAIPNVTLQLVLQRDNATQSTQASSLVSLPLPLFNRNQGNVYRTMSQISAADAELDRVRLVLRDLLSESFRRYRVNRMQMERFRDKILPAAEENMQLTVDSFEAGERSFSEVLTARETYFKAQLVYVDSLTELRKAIVEIDGLQLTGGLNPAEIGTAIQAMPGGGGQRQRALLNQVQDSAARQLLPAAQLGR